MNKYKSLVFRELKLSARHYMLRGLMFLAFIVMLVLVMFVLKPQAAKEMCNMRGFALMGAYVVGIMGAIIIGEDNGVYKADVNTGWLTYSWTLPLTSFEKAMTKNIVRVILIAAGSVITVLSAILIFAISGTAFNVNTILSLFIFIDIALIFNIILEAFFMRATDTKSLKKVGTIAGAVLAVLIFLPDILSLGQPGSAESKILEQATQSIEIANYVFYSFKMPEIIGYISIPLMIIVLIAGFIITKKNFEKREA